MSFPHRYRTKIWSTLGRPEFTSELLPKWEQQRSAVNVMKNRPLVSVVIIDSDPASTGLDDSVESVLAQSYPHWEVIAVTSRTSSHADARIRYVRWPEVSGNSPLQAATCAKNTGAAIATGEWIGFLDAGDELNPLALYLMVVDSKDSDCVYTHENFPGGQALTKPQASLFTLLHWNYVGRFWMVRRSEFRPLDEKYDEGSEHLFLLSLGLAHKNFQLVPYYLHHSAKKESICRGYRDCGGNSGDAPWRAVGISGAASGSRAAENHPNN